MQRKLFPVDILEKSIEGYLPRIAVKSQLIYSITVASIILILSSLPFLYIDVSVPATGVLRTSNEKTELRSLVSGVIRTTIVRENQSVKINEILYEISNAELSARVQLNVDQQREKTAFITDLKRLLRIKKESLLDQHSLGTSLYAQQFFSFQSRMQENFFHQQKIKKELDADRKLFREKVIAMREFDAKDFEYTQLVAQYESMFRQQMSQWQSDMNNQATGLQQLQSERRQFDEQMKGYFVKAPVAGNILQTSGKYAGSFIQAGEILAIISPDDSLIIAECYVLPRDIGLVKMGQPVLFRIDAFNYNEWGMVKGTVIDIAHDFTLVHNQPVFKVKCSLFQKHLTLKNGYSVFLTKGLSLRAEFTVTRRSLFQLIYDKTDDWLNPKNGG